MHNPASRRDPRSHPRWRPSLLTNVIVVLALGGLTAGLYPMSASWLSSYNQSHVLTQAETGRARMSPPAPEQLRLAHEYNEALIAGVRLDPWANVPVGSGNPSDTLLRYDDLLTSGPHGLMSRIRIPSIGVDLPIYHGTATDTLLRGAGHLEGSHLPVGGTGTRSVITAHRGLANATMFSQLNGVRIGDTFTLEVLGDALVYRVTEMVTIEPEDSGSLRAEAGKDLVTLITCTPLGINSHRILVTGERVIPTPAHNIAELGDHPQVPGVPWWIFLASTGLITITAYLIRRGYIDDRNRQSRRDYAGDTHQFAEADAT